MDETSCNKLGFHSIKSNFDFGMSAVFKKSNRKKKLEPQKHVELQDDEELNVAEEHLHTSNKKKKKSLVHRLHLNRLRGQVPNERHGPEGGDSTHSLSHNQFSLRESPNLRECEGDHRIESSTEKGGSSKERGSLQPLCTVTVVQRKSPSLTISQVPQPQQLLHCSITTLPQPKLTPQAELQRKLQVLNKHHDYIKIQETQSITSSDASSSPDHSGKTVVDVDLSKEAYRWENRRPARYISVCKFDTFSTFEGTFEEDIDQNYPASISEDRRESCDCAGMLISENIQDNLMAQSNLVVTSTSDKREHLYKVLVIGELGAGKTSIIKRYVHQFFSQHYRATIGVDFALKVLNWDPQTIIRLQLWDIAGQERFGNMTRVYYKEAVGAFIVFDVTRSATLDAVVKWKQDLDSKVQLPDGSPIPCILLANKCDQQKEGLVNFPGKMDDYCKEKNFSGWFETSAKENINIEEAAAFLVNKLNLSLWNDNARNCNFTTESVVSFKGVKVMEYHSKVYICATFHGYISK